MISGLAVIAIEEDGGWTLPINYTPVYSAVIKVARILVVYQSYLEREAFVHKLRRTGLDQEEARQQAPGIFELLRPKVRRFMTRVGDEADAAPTPMDWILDTRTYGMRIRFTMPGGGSIDWQGEYIIHQRIRFSMGQLSDMLHTVTSEARGLLAPLAMVDGEAFPTIPWAQIQDDHSEERVGYSFLTDDRNTWVQQGEHWVFSRIRQSQLARQRWLQETAAGQNPFRAKTVRAYAQQAEQFRAKLFLLMHMVSGQPARAPEILSIRSRNTANGGIRNLFVHDGMVCFVTTYHKNYRSSGEVKVIHRYLPREVGELLVWYLWLVLPFWQQVQGIVKGGTWYSPFLWADQIIERDQGSSSEDTPETEEEWEAAVWFRERKWTSDRVRRVMQQHSERLMGSAVGISAWRHIAIAIANRFSNKAFGDMDGEEGEDEDGIEDSPWDLQAGHGSLIAGLAYARMLLQSKDGTAAQRQQFRRISQQWHRFLGFGAADHDGTKAVGPKRRRDGFESVREDARFQRFARFQRANIQAELRVLVGTTATFRGQQEAVIRAVMRGESPIVQITGTGGGKSLTFLLPAFCEPEGTTVVIVPLISLRADLQRRCMASGISSYIWQSRGAHQAASIVFVTPESAVTKGFRGFINRLQARQALDRVVVDECHTLAEGQDDFRPPLRMIGTVLQEWGIQTVFFTATLPPRDERAFFQTAKLAVHRVRMFRARTTRTNIAYRVWPIPHGAPESPEKEEDKWVCRQVQTWLTQHGRGKVIIYAPTIARVERLAELVGCARFHSKIGSEAVKVQTLQTWRDEGTVTVATNALGLGLDVPDVRLVIHAGTPRRLADYAQESGRAGRDGMPSEAVIVYAGRGGAGPAHSHSRQKRGQAQAAIPGPEKAVEKYIEGQWCRRIVLDEIMDGYTTRTACEEGEAACDICKRLLDEEERDALIAMAADEEDRLDADAQQIAENFERTRRQAWFARWTAAQNAMRASEVGEMFEAQLALWADCCVVCRFSGGEDYHHTMGECPSRGGARWEAVEAIRRGIYQTMFEEKRFARFSGCFHCGLPQAICDRWASEEEDGGRFHSSGRQACQYDGVVVQALAGASAYHYEEVTEMVERMMAEDGFDGEGEDRMYSWMGRRVRWSGMETNQMCRVFYMICQHIEEMGQ